MKNLRVLAGAVLFVSSMAVLPGQTPAVFPSLDVRAPIHPRPLNGGGVIHLGYELYITNLAPYPTTIDAVETRDAAAPANAPPLLRLEGDALEASIRRLGHPRDEPDKRVLPAGGATLLFVWIAARQGAVPAALTHRFMVHVATPTPTALTIDGVRVDVARVPPRVFGPPLEGDHWLAANGPDNGADHRRAVFALAGQTRIAQRFAIDWVRLFDDGRTFHGDPKNNASYRAFGAHALAVANAIVGETTDGIPENVPDATARAVPISPATVGGNFVRLDFDDGTSAVYAHLQPGSLTVKKGDRVRRGQVLGLVGNTGNSSEPHLHFHLTDGHSAYDAEGIPYAFNSYDLEAPADAMTAALIPVDSSLGLSPAGLDRWHRGPVVHVVNEMPLGNAIVHFK